jgi:hypothetical protein
MRLLKNITDNQHFKHLNPLQNYWKKKQVYNILKYRFLYNGLGQPASYTAHRITVAPILHQESRPNILKASIDAVRCSTIHFLFILLNRARILQSEVQHKKNLN